MEASGCVCLKVLKVFDVDGVGTDFEELLVLRVLLEVPRVRRTLDCRHERRWNLKSVSVESETNCAWYGQGWVSALLEKQVTTSYYSHYFQRVAGEKFLETNICQAYPDCGLFQYPFGVKNMNWHFAKLKNICLGSKKCKRIIKDITHRSP